MADVRENELTEQEIIEAVERALDGQLRDTEVRAAGDSDSEEFDCEGNPECENCFANCENEENCAMLCALLFRQEDEDKRKVSEDGGGADVNLFIPDKNTRAGLN
ncbi:hypothetical protein MAR_030499 [Mya arenaria]|uniref:Uncharacterized protein n=1 Tax=Mya arenaria TaxID=6604 RepID=A0ABY7F144_MYAAR|nr:hypothetical protein MAR_030499 [Mya arenaria]